MTTRVLPQDEWSKLAATAVGPVWSWLPAGARPVVVESEGQVLGCHVLVPVWHVEGLWIAEAHRGRASVARRLWAGVQAEAQALGVDHVITAAVDDRVRGLLAHVGAVPLPDHYVVSVGR